ncbi:MAG: hypothetical protein JXA71_11155 [Chitinispirillaceae bacterium]|nr:hypothetical protein [Chitinispirillaceae bacterium]
MISGKTIFVSILFSCCFLFVSFAQEDPKPWEKYGLSQTEWKMIQDRQIPLSKVEQLLRSGISIGEYIEQPWKKYLLSEKAYIEKRRSGLTAYDIELEQTSNRSGWKDDNRGAMLSETSSLSGSKELLVSFVLPGLQQRRLGHTWRSRIMGTIAIGSIAGSLFFSIADAKPEFTPLFVVLVPDMFWSMLDFKFSRNSAKQE